MIVNSLHLLIKKNNKAHTRLSPARGGRGRWMRQEITKALLRVKRSCATGFLTAFSSSDTHILFPPPGLTAASDVVKCQHLVSSLSLSFSLRLSGQGELHRQDDGPGCKPARPQPALDTRTHAQVSTGLPLSVFYWLAYVAAGWSPSARRLHSLALLILT